MNAADIALIRQHLYGDSRSPEEVTQPVIESPVVPPEPEVRRGEMRPCYACTEKVFTYDGDMPLCRRCKR